MHKQDPKIKTELFYEYGLILPLDIFTVKNMYGWHFQRKAVNFISKNIPIFGRHINPVITYVKYPTKTYRYKILMSVPLKDVLYWNQQYLPLTHMAKMILQSSLKIKNIISRLHSCLCLACDNTIIIWVYWRNHQVYQKNVICKNILCC